MSKNNEAPYGFRRNEAALVPHEGEQGVIQSARRLRAAGLTNEQVAAELDSAGLLAPPRVRRRSRKPKPSAADNLVANMLFSFQQYAIGQAAEKAMEAWDKTRQMGKTAEEADGVLCEAGFDPEKMKEVCRRDG